MKTKGLSIQEAIQSGLPFKRENDALWTVGSGKIRSLTILESDILATDYEIKVPEVTITREKLAEAWDKHVYTYPHSGMGKANGSNCFDLFCKELGL